MKTKIYLTLFVVFGLLKTFAQSYEEQYLLEEQSRLDQVKIIENEIQTFINQNINTYDFTQVINNVNNMKDEDGQSFSGDHYQQILRQAKEEKLRNLFFQQNPEKLKYFYSTPLKQQCINGGFENGTTAGFNFFSQQFNGSNGNPIWNNFNNNPITPFPAVPSLNSTAIISLVDTSSFDPNVTATNLPRVNNGRFAIKLNSSPVGNTDVSKLSRTFVVNETSISFAFALVMQDPHGANSGINPYMQVRLRNTATQAIVYQQNIVADTNNLQIFHINPSNGVIYTDWLCERIDTSLYMNQTMTLEIIMTDCGMIEHWGYGYFDDFCGFNCSQPAFSPFITLNPIRNNNCPILPITVTGNYSIPQNAVLSNIMLFVQDASNNANVSSQLITTATAGNFSFNLTNSDFYPNLPSNITNFNIRAQLNYTINGIPQNTLVAFHTNPPGPDITFNNCPIPCQEEWRFETNQPITTSNNYYAFGSIYSASAIYPNLNVEFRAAYDIQLTNGFYATGHNFGNFHAYIAPCEQSNMTQGKQSKVVSENNFFKNSNIKISPNPASTFINIDSGNEKITSWELFDISGKSLLKGNSTQVNVQGLPKAAYLLKININNKITTKKVIVK